VLNEEVAVTMKPIEQQHKFDQIQQADNELNSLYKAQYVAKKELCDFQPVIQIVYMKMHQVDATADFEWNSLVAAKPNEYNKETTQQFLVEASLLAWKWHEKVESFHRVKHRALEMVLELGPLFEEVKEEKVETKDPK
jgi:hypothetical protein